MSIGQPFEDPKLLQYNNFYELNPGDEIDYAIDYEKQASNMVNKKKRYNQSEVITNNFNHLSHQV